MKAKNIIFDLGGVILNIDFGETIKAFKNLIPNLDDHVFYGSKEQMELYTEFEVGKYDIETFIKNFNFHHGTALDHDTFERAWNTMIFDFPMARVQLLEKLRKEGKRLFLLSNINAIHEKAVANSFSKLNLNFNLHDLFEKVYYSHLIGMRKPHPEIFEKVLFENNLRRDETLFIDDSLQHIESAELLGLQVYHLKRPQESLEVLDIFK